MPDNDKQGTAGSPEAGRGADASIKGAVGYLTDIAAQAPSAARVRPWRFRSHDGSVDILLGDYNQGGLTTESARRQAVVACGAALFNLTLAMGHLGLEPQVSLWLDDPRPGDRLAVVTPGRHRPARPDDERLLAAVPWRRSSRRSFYGVPPSDGIVDRLKDAAAADGAVLVEAVGTDRVVLDGIVDGTERRYDDPTARKGLRGAWARRDVTSCRTFLLCTAQDRPEDWLSCGQALQHVLLEATSLELAVHLHSEALEITEERVAVQEKVTQGLAPHIILQVGGPAQGPAWKSRTTVAASSG